jgi:ArsR family transcriptional regulator
MKNLWLFDESRLAILCKLLGCREASGCDLQECLAMKRPLMSHHLALLRDRGIIEERQKGREKRYRIVPSKRRFVRAAITVAQ